MNESEDDTLFSKLKNENDDEYSTHLLEQYKIYVENTDKLIDRRDKANTFFLSANSFLLSALGVMTQIGFSGINISWICIAAVGGIVFAMTWLFIVRSFRQLSTAKFTVINQIEKRLPISPFTTEWKFLEYGKNPKKYIKLTIIETFVPMIFGALYVSLCVLVLY